MRRSSLLVCFMGSLVLVSNAVAAEEVPPESTTGEAAAAPPVGERPPSPVTEQTAPMPLPAQPPVIVSVAPATAPPPSFRVEGASGSSIRVGILLQPQFMAASNAARDGYSKNLYIRRTRILLGGTLFGAFEYFIDTDYPNLFLANNVAGTGGAADTAVKATPGMNIQDAFGTWKVLKDSLKIDVGYMLPPLAHNAVQGATSLYSWDYFSYSFQHSANGVFSTSASSVGRDTGVQARGLLVDGHVEYRAGLFQGRRDGQTTADVAARNFFRFAARLQINLLDPETGFFYQGSYLGSKKIVSLGGSVDIQDTYKYFAGDVFVDLPLDQVGVLTVQGNYAHWNGGSFAPEMLKESALMTEAGFLVSAVQLSPILRFEHLWVSSGNSPDETRYVAGLAYWPFGHNSNLKAFYSRIHDVGANRDTNQFNVQWQLFVY
jgi:hypothetical protein